MSNKGFFNDRYYARSFFSEPYFGPRTTQGEVATPSPENTTAGIGQLGGSGYGRSWIPKKKRLPNIGSLKSAAKRKQRIKPWADDSEILAILLATME